jgi:hypothetical protein
MSEIQNFIYDNVYSILVNPDMAEIHIGRKDYPDLSEIIYRSLFQHNGNVYFHDENVESPRKFAILKMLELISVRLGIKIPTLIEMGNLRLLDFDSKEDAVVFLFYYYDKITERYSESIFQFRKLY